MKKILLIIGFALTPYSAHAGLFDSVKTIVGGHIDDIASRFEDDQFVKGDVVAQVKFREDDRGQDMLHHGSGTVQLIKNSDGQFIQLGTDFSSTPGPDYHIYISQDIAIDHEDAFIKKNQIELGRLIKGSGATFYQLPDGAKFQSVTIWCKAFGEFIVSADFNSQI